MDQDSITDESLFWDESSYNNLMDIRTNEVIIYNLNEENVNTIICFFLDILASSFTFKVRKFDR